MSNIKYVFLGTEETNTHGVELECFLNEENQISITLEDTDCQHDYNIQYISIDKSTAIKLAKTLRTEINKIKDE